MLHGRRCATQLFAMLHVCVREHRRVCVSVNVRAYVLQRVRTIVLVRICRMFATETLSISGRHPGSASVDRQVQGRNSKYTYNLYTHMRGCTLTPTRTSSHSDLCICCWARVQAPWRGPRNQAQIQNACSIYTCLIHVPMCLYVLGFARAWLQCFVLNFL